MLKTLNNKYAKLIRVYALADYMTYILMGLNSRFNAVTKKNPIECIKMHCFDYKLLRVYKMYVYIIQYIVCI